MLAYRTGLKNAIAVNLEVYGPFRRRRPSVNRPLRA